MGWDCAATSLGWSGVCTKDVTDVWSLDVAGAWSVHGLCIGALGHGVAVAAQPHLLNSVIVYYTQAIYGSV